MVVETADIRETVRLPVKKKISKHDNYNWNENKILPSWVRGLTRKQKERYAPWGAHRSVKERISFRGIS